MGDAKFVTKSFELRIVKLAPVVCDNSLGQIKLANNRLPYKITDFSFSDGRQCFHFHPFDEVVDCDEQKSFYAAAIGKGPSMSIFH